MSQIAAYIALACFAYLAIFQALLALGAPIGHLAWGGQTKKLPIKLRIASFFSIGIAVLGSISVLVSKEWIGVAGFGRVAGIVLWILVCMFALSTLGNAVSKSKPERLTGTPVAFLLFISCLILALDL